MDQAFANMDRHWVTEMGVAAASLLPNPKALHSSYLIFSMDISA
jgi:hypothetical protein